MGKAIKLNNKKTGEALYPMTASDMVFDPSTKKSVKADLAEKIGDAPSDGKQYARMDGAWNEVSIPEGGVEEAPKDGLQYVRKDGSWEQISPEELCQITLKSNQGDDDAASLIGVSVKVIATEDSSELFNGTWNGETIIVPVTQGKEYKVVVGELEGYSTPAEQTYTSSAFVNRNVVMMYNTELVRVTLSADDSSNVSGQIVTINGEEFTYGSTAVEKKVAFGTEYTVSVNDKSGYITPASQTFTASEFERNLEVVYEFIPIGIFIQGVSKKLYKYYDWDNQETPNGIAVLTENCKFVMALEDAGDKTIWGGYGTIVQNIVTTTDSSEAKLDYNGRNNTNEIINQIESAYAAERCNDYIFPNAQTGYLGSGGEWNAILNNYNDIVYSLNACGGAAFHTAGTYYLTSTQYDGYNIWICNPNSAIAKNSKQSYFWCRALTEWSLN